MKTSGMKCLILYRRLLSCKSTLMTMIVGTNDDNDNAAATATATATAPAAADDDDDDLMMI